MFIYLFLSIGKSQIYPNAISNGGSATCLNFYMYLCMYIYV